MGLKFLGDEWIAEVDGRCAALPAVPDVEPARIRYTSLPGETSTWSQTIDDGRVRWHTGPIPEPDVEIRWTPPVAFGVLSGAWDGNAAMANTTIVEQRNGVRYVGPPPPMDIGHQPEIASLPQVAGATIRLGCECTDGPFGTTTVSLDFRDGQFVSVRRGIFEGTDVALRLSFRQLMHLRRGRLTILDVIATGDVGGTQGALMLMAGIAESPEYQAAMRSAASGSGSAALAALGEIVREPAYRSAMESVFALTSEV